MAKRQLPSQEVLRQLLDYDPETGVLRWKQRGPEWFKTERSRKTWNARFCGKPALARKINGYMYGDICAVSYASHRVIWKMVHGSDADEIDHINGNRSDNRLKNLRSVTGSENLRNRKTPNNSSSGVMGVSLRRDTGKWVAHICFDGDKRRLGSFASFEEAVAARKAAEAQFGFHPNHGR